MSPRYRPDIDGLRAIAVVCVIAFHMGGRAVAGGYIGVDVFFVISGYLIAGLVFAEVQAGRFSLVGFYERRIRRLQPALLAMIATTALAAAVLLTPVDFKRFAQSVAAALLSCSNGYFYLKDGYFEPSAQTQPLLHTWSLAVEEQFYLLFPLLALACARARWRVPALVALIVLSFGASLVELAGDAAAAFYLPFGRCWELLGGALLAGAPMPLPVGREMRVLAGAAGLLSIVAAAVLYTRDTPFPGLAALLPTVGTAMLIAAGPDTPTNRILASAPLVGIGRISYSLYLWHWPILVLIGYALFRDLTAIEGLTYLLALWLIAWVSWRYIEEPFRRRRGLLLTRAALFGVGAAAVSLGLVFALAVQFGDGFPGRFSEPARRYAAAALDVNPRRGRCDSRPATEVEAGNVCTLGRAGIAPRFALVGDSFADAIAPGFDEAADALRSSGVSLTHGGCVPLLEVQQGNDCAAFYEAVRRYLESHPSISTVVLVARWSAALLGTRFGQYQGHRWLLTDAQSTERSSAENQRVFVRGFERTLRAFDGKRVVVLAYVPEQRYDVPRALALSALWGYPREIALPASLHAARQAAVRRVLDALRGGDRFELLDVGASMCSRAQCPVQIGETVLYADDTHLSRSASERLEPLWERALLIARQPDGSLATAATPSVGSIRLVR